MNQLRKVFEEHVRLEIEKPYMEYDIIIDSPTEEFESFTHWYFFHNNGERVLTNRPSLGIGFKFTEEEEVKFKSLSISDDFERDNADSNKVGYTIDCGADATKAATIVEIVLSKVYRLTTFPKFKNEFLFQRDKKSIKSYIETHLPMMFCFDLPITADMETISRQAARVKKCMDKYNFGKVEMVTPQRCVKGYYCPTAAPDGFFAEIKHTGQIGDCEAELIKLLDLCYESFK